MSLNVGTLSAAMTSHTQRTIILQLVIIFVIGQYVVSFSVRSHDDDDVSDNREHALHRQEARRISAMLRHYLARVVNGNDLIVKRESQVFDDWPLKLIASGNLSRNFDIILQLNKTGIKCTVKIRSTSICTYAFFGESCSSSELRHLLYITDEYEKLNLPASNEFCETFVFARPGTTPLRILYVIQPAYCVLENKT